MSSCYRSNTSSRPSRDALGRHEERAVLTWALTHTLRSVLGVDCHIFFYDSSGRYCRGLFNTKHAGAERESLNHAMKPARKLISARCLCRHSSMNVLAIRSDTDCFCSINIHSQTTPHKTNACIGLCKLWDECLWAGARHCLMVYIGVGTDV